MSWIAVAIGAGSAIFGAVQGADSARKAAHTQQDAANAAIETQQQNQQQTRSDLAPWMQGGQSGNQALLQYLGIGSNGQFDPNAPGVAPFNASMLPGDPSYQWRVQQGQNALLNNASALGTLGSGNTLKAITNYGQQAATQQYQQALQNYMQQQGNVVNRLSGVSNTGVNAAGNVAGLGANSAGNIAGLQYAGGQAGAGGLIAGNNAIAGSAQNGINNWLLANYLQQGRGGAGGGGVNGLYQPLDMGPQLPQPTGYDFGGM